MVDTIKYKNSFSEVLYLINKMNIEDRNKISPKFIDFLEENKLDNEINENLNLENIDLLSRETRIVLSIIYRKYFITKEELDELEKEEKSVYVLEEKNIEKDQLVENMEVNQENSNSTITNNENMALIESKEEMNIIEKIMLKLKNFFSKLIKK